MLMKKTENEKQKYAVVYITAYREQPKVIYFDTEDIRDEFFNQVLITGEVKSTKVIYAEKASICNRYYNFGFLHEETRKDMLEVGGRNA